MLNDFFQSDIIKRTYEDNDNYFVIDCNKNSDICIAFFSGNGLYYPNSIGEFEKQIVCANRFEWKNLARTKVLRNYAGRMIFVRDIYKSWYIRGINAQVNSVEKVIDLIKKLSKDYQLITVGNSAGGYMAVLTTSILGGKSCFNFCGQYNILSEKDKNFFVSQGLKNLQIEKYFDIVSYLENNHTPIYYFWPADCEIDIIQANRIMEVSCVKSLPFKGEKHGKTVASGNLPYILSLQDDKLQYLLDKYKGKVISKFRFVFDTMVWYKALYILITEWIKIIGRKVKKGIRKRK